MWSEQSSGMLQFVDDEVKKERDIPASWKLITQMRFGTLCRERACSLKTL
ncbi:hypothetical protein J7E26_03065 [Bacillus sp. ISL-51]|nr:hypothetical protein [Pseudomonas sp. ISL-88]MBT2572942.1 hypothetical protein [Bacillus sp. ISL-51]MBT2713415.1 hypothetical protein [Pseudomonas sp. ISL-88]